MSRRRRQWARSTASLVGVISDTHGLLRPEALAALQDCALVLHAGDVGRPETLAALRASVPRLVAVRGNVDEKWSCDLPDRAFIAIRGWRVALVHDLHDLTDDGERFDAVVCGHSHQPRIDRRGGVLYVNPGSAGPRRFRLPVAVARLTMGPETIEAETVELQV